MTLLIFETVLILFLDKRLNNLTLLFVLITYFVYSFCLIRIHGARRCFASSKYL